MKVAVSETLRELGELLRQARLAAGLSQEQVADLAGISRPRYRDIETGMAAARATTLMNVSRALGLEMMLVPQATVPAVRALMRPHDEDDLPAFVRQPDEDENHGPMSAQAVDFRLRLNAADDHDLVSVTTLRVVVGGRRLLH